MERERYKHLSETGEAPTAEEFNAGWHFCHEWDGLLVGPGWPEMNCCKCLPEDHPYHHVPVNYD